MKIRQSVPTKGIAEKYLTRSWRYVMPDFDRPDHSIIEQIEYRRVPASPCQDDESANGRPLSSS